MLIEKGEWEISDVVVSLGDILKYSLHGEEMLVLFEEELKYIESYLCIQKNRLEDRLTVQIEIDEEAKLCFVPKLILQPIVENAILHGIEKKKEMGRIQIQAIVREGTPVSYTHLYLRCICGEKSVKNREENAGTKKVSSFAK